MSHIKGRTIQINKNVKQKSFFFFAKNVKKQIQRHLLNINYVQKLKYTQT